MLGFLMKVTNIALFLIFLALPSQLFAQETNYQAGFISDDLFIFMHSGAGKNYRITGSINAGTEIKLTGEQKNDFTEILDDKNRKAWVESKYVSVEPGLRNIIAELNGRLAAHSENENSLNAAIEQDKTTINRLQEKNTSLKNQLATLNADLTSTKSKLKDQDTNIKKEWFFNGAIVLGLGLLLGLIIPRLASSRKQQSMNSWK